MVKGKGVDTYGKDMQYYVKISNEVMLKNVHRRKALTKDLVEKYLSSGKYNICIVASGPL